MKTAISIACAWFALFGFSAHAQQPTDPDGPEEIMKVIAKTYEDQRSIAQIKKDNAMIRAAMNGDAGAVQTALKSGARVNSIYIDGYAFLDGGSSGYTALMRASSEGHLEVVRILIEAKADLDMECKSYGERHRNSLYMAVMSNHNEVAKLLVKSGAKGDLVKIQLTHDLLRAACKGFQMKEGEGFPRFPGTIGDPKSAPDLVEVLKRGADVNASDPEGYTALMYAANLGLIENVEILLANGADASLKSRSGETALSLTEQPGSSASEGRQKIVHLLRASLAKKQ